MFRLEEILCSNQFIRKFQSITRELNKQPGAILVTRRSGEHFVFVNADLYQQLLDRRIADEEHWRIMQSVGGGDS